MKVLAVLLAMLIATPSLASIDVTLHYIPEGKRLVVSGETYQGFTFDEWKALLAVDYELWTLKQKDDVCTGLVGDLKLKISKLEELTAFNEKIYSILQKENERLYQKWEKADEALQRAKEDDDMWHWVAHAILGGIVLGAGTAIVFLAK